MHKILDKIWTEPRLKGILILDDDFATFSCQAKQNSIYFAEYNQTTCLEYTNIFYVLFAIYKNVIIQHRFCRNTEAKK